MLADLHEGLRRLKLMRRRGRAFVHHPEADGGAYPRVLDREGTAPPQYPDLDEVE